MRRTQGFLIEIRLPTGISKRVKSIEKNLRKVHRKRSKHRFVPHMTVIRPFRGKSKDTVARIVRDTCANPLYSFFPPSYKIRGFGTFKGKGVVWLRPEPNLSLKFLQWRLKHNLKNHVKLHPADFNVPWVPHITVAKGLSKANLQKTQRALKKKRMPRTTVRKPRITILCNGKIHREYDFRRKRLVNKRR